MEVKRALSVSAETVNDASGATIRWLWGKADQAPSFALRLIEVQPGGATPHHAHPYEHEVYVLEGRARLVGDEREHVLEPGDTALVRPDERHQFVNAGSEVLRFLCGIPL
jgi:quercetin dioxygenase-like cupin family protein